MNRDLFDAVHWLIGAATRGLAARNGPGITEVLSRLSMQPLAETQFREPEPRRLPVLEHLPQCLGEAMLLDAELAAAIAALEEALQWRQSEAYSDDVLGQGFLANYGWSEIIGPNGFFPGDDLLFGLLMLGPGRHYRDHYHPAPELYWPLTSASLWKRGREPFAEQPQGATIWHPPMMVHATKTAETPLLTLWCWTRDVATPAKLVD